MVAGKGLLEWPSSPMRGYPDHRTASDCKVISPQVGSGAVALDRQRGDTQGHLPSCEAMVCQSQPLARRTTRSADVAVGLEHANLIRAPGHLWRCWRPRKTGAAEWPGLPAPSGVQIISVDEGGHPALDRPADRGGLSKRTLGIANGAVLIIGNPILSETITPVRVAEGLADSLAIAARYEGPVVAMAGTSGMRNPELAVWLATAPAGVIIHADSDEARAGRAPAGTTAAGCLRQGIADSGGAASAVYPVGCTQGCCGGRGGRWILRFGRGLD